MSRRSSAISRRSYNGKTYMITLDGDFQMVYYRTDVLQGTRHSSRRRPGTTISTFAKAANGKDLNGDGKPDFGSCISKKRNAQAYWCDHLDRRPLLPVARAPAQGAFFDPRDLQAAGQQ